MVFFGLAWVMYQRAAFLHVGQTEDTAPNPSLKRQVVFQDEDTLRYNGYTIVRTEVGVVISKSGKTVYHSPEGLERKGFNEIGLASFLGNNTRQLVIQRFSGGSDCCCSSWMLELADSVRFLYRSEDYPELGYELGFADYDEDGTIELTQTNMSFDRFDRLSHAASPFSTVYFKYSPGKRRYILANRFFAKLFLEEANEKTKLLKAFAQPIDAKSFVDSTGEYVSAVLDVMMEFVYAGEKERGWIFFDEWYRLPDKTKMKKKIQAVLESSRIFKELYSGQAGEVSSK